MKKNKYLIIILLICIFVSSSLASDVNIPLKESTINAILKSLKPELAVKLREAGGNDFAGRSPYAKVEYAYFDLKEGNNITFYFYGKTFGTFDWVLGSSPFTVYIRTKSNLNFEMVYDPVTNKLKPNISSVSPTQVDISCSNSIVGLAIWFYDLLYDILDSIVADIDAMLPDMINDFLPPLTINLPDNANLHFESLTYDSQKDALIVGLEYYHMDVISDPPAAESKVDDNLYIPKLFSLKQNYPNPFNPTTYIEFEIPIESDVILNVFNMQGEKVAELFKGRKSAGKYTIQFNGTSLPSGVYLYEIIAGTFKEVKKMTLIK